MREMAAGQFKTHCLAVMDEVQAKREPVVITKRGKPVAKLVPVDLEAGKDPIFGLLKDKAWIIGDPEELVKPIVPEEDWRDNWEPAE
jgi:prevent-host-death family protein